MSAFRHVAILRTIGVIVLLVGLGSAGIVVWRGQSRPATATTASDWKDSSLSLTDSKTATRNIELYGGKVEVLMVQLLDWVHRPAAQAGLIVASAVLVALGCFLFARYLSANAENPNR